MIIAITNQNASSGNVARQLAALRAHVGGKVLLLATDPKLPSASGSPEHGVADIGPGSVSERCLLRAELENPHFKDIIIDIGGRDSLDSRAALIAAGLVIVPVQADQLDMGSQYKLIARLNSARMFNPGLRVLFVIVGGGSDPSDQERAAICAYVAQVMSAKLAGTVIHVPGALPCDVPPAAGEVGHAPEEMSALYREVFAN